MQIGLYFQFYINIIIIIIKIIRKSQNEASFNYYNFFL